MTYWNPSSVSSTSVWLIVLSSCVVLFPISIGSLKPMTIALSDIVLPLLAVASIVKRGWDRRFTYYFSLCAAIIILIAAHSVIIYSASNHFNVVWSIREFIKSASIPVIFLSVFIIVVSWNLPEPNFSCIIIAVAFGMISILVLHYLEYHHSSLVIYVPRTTAIAGLWGLAFLYAAMVKTNYPSDIFQRLLVLFAAISVFSVMVYSKLGGAIGGLAIIWLIARRLLSNRFLIRNSVVIMSIGAVVLLGVLIFIAQDSSSVATSRIQSFAQSFDTRVRLWELSAQGIFDNLGLGVGLGQVASIYTQDPVIGIQNHHFPHSVFFSFATQLGLLGIVLFLGLAVVVVRALTGYRDGVYPIAIILFVPLIIFHDIHATRILILIIALGLVLSIRKRTAPLGARTAITGAANRD